jgi:membrane protein DedA with SNARE-associated domain
MGAVMLRVLAIILLCIGLQGCATLTVATIGAAIGIGVATGAGKFAGERIARSGWRRHVAYKRCQHLRNDYYQLEQCVRRYIVVRR